MASLMLPVVDENTQEIQSLCLYSLKDKKPHNLKLPENLKNPQCVGSSHGWLAFLDEYENPFLLNPFSKTQIYLPPLQNPTISYKISKLILSQNPSSHPDTYAAVVMHSFSSRTNISFCRKGDTAWRNLHAQREYYDVVCCHQTNTLLALAPGPTVESWNLNDDYSFPKKTVIIEESCPRMLRVALETFPADLYSSQWYLAVSPAGEIFMAVRYIGEFVRYDGKVVYEGDTLTDYAAEPLVCPYRTVGFRVFRISVDGGRSEWVDVDCLNDYAMFLGGNESVMVSSQELKKNAIYFTDDYWERIDEDYSYGGHDFGVFCMEDGTVQTVFDIEQDKIHPPPFWITLPRDDQCHQYRR